MSGPALLLLGLAVTGSARTAALLYAALTIAGGCGGPLFGVLLDRSAAPGRVLAWALAGYAAGLGVVAVSLGHLPLVAVAVLAAAAGFLAPSLTGGWTSRLPVPRHSLDAATYAVAALVGPALAGLIAAAAGAAWAMALVVILLFLAAPAAWRLPGTGSRHATVGADLRAGFSAILRIRPLLRITLCSVLAYLGVGMLVVACPLLGHRDLGSTDRGALLLSLIAAASLAANAVLARWPPPVSPDILFALATALIGLTFLALAAVPGLWPLIAVIGLGDGPQLAAILAVRHREAPDRLRSQVFTTAASLKIGAGALGAALAGHLAGHSPAPVLAAAAATQAVALVAFALTSRRPRPRRGRHPDPVTEGSACAG